MSKFDLQKYISQSPLLEGTSYTPNSEEDGKMIYKSHLLEGLTKEEADSFREKYKKRYASILKSNPDFIKKYPNPDAVVHGMVVKEIVKLREKLSSNDPIEKYVDDFQNSDAKQFQNKSEEDINKMAQAAYFSKTKNEQMENPRLQELVKKALANPISEKVEFTDKHDDDKGLKGKQKDLPDNLQAKILNKEEIKLTTKQRATVAQNIVGLPLFAKEVLDHIEKLESIEGKGHINSPKIQGAIRILKTLMPKQKEETLSERIFNELREGKSIKLTDEEQNIVDDITESLNEGILDFDKIKQYAKKGLMTAAILLSLNATGFSAEQQQKISDIVKTEMPASKKGEVDRIYKVSVVIDALKKYQKGKKKGKDLENLSSELEQSLITLEKGHNVDDVVKVFNNHGNDLDKFISWR